MFDIFPWKNRTIISYICLQYPEYCTYLIMFLISDARPGLDDKYKIPVLMGHLPAGTSLWNVRHFY